MGISGHDYANKNVYLTTPSYIMPHRESEDMTIYDVFRHIISKIPWDGADFNEENERKAAATKLIDRLEELGFFGQLGLDIKEKI